MTTIYIGADHAVELIGLKNSVDNSSVDNATVECTLVDVDGASVAGQTWPLTMEFVAASNGNYRGILEDSLSLTKAAFYTARIAVSTPQGLKRTFVLPLQADFG